MSFTPLIKLYEQTFQKWAIWCLSGLQLGEHGNILMEMIAAVALLLKRYLYVLSEANWFSPWPYRCGKVHVTDFTLILLNFGKHFARWDQATDNQCPGIIFLTLFILRGGAGLSSTSCASEACLGLLYGTFSFSQANLKFNIYTRALGSSNNW